MITMAYESRRVVTGHTPPTGKAFDVEFGQTTNWDDDQLTVISAFWDAALQRQQIGLA